MTLTRHLAEIAVNTPASQVTPAAIAAAKKMCLDTLGVCIAGANASGLNPILQQVRKWGGAHEATVLVHGDTMSAHEAAFVNSVQTHALDFDDVFVPGHSHFMCILLPTALAVGELAGATGTDVLAATIIGMEVAGRLSRVFMARATTGGFLPSSIVGVFAAGATASRLLKLNVEQTVNAMGLGYAQACGNRQALFDKTLAKRIQPGLAARAGIWSAEMAKAGLTGPPLAMEGKAGLFRLYINAEPPAADELTTRREQFEIERLSVKMFPACGATHAITKAAIDLANEHDLTAEEIQRVSIFQNPGGNPLVGGAFEIGDNPQVDAQFSVAYGAALGLLYRRAELDQFTDSQVRRDERAADLARGVIFPSRMDSQPLGPRIEDDMPEWFDRGEVLIVNTHDGRELRNVVTGRQVLDPQAMSFDDTVRKFQQCVKFGGVFSTAQAGRIASLVDNLDACDSPSQLIGACVMRHEERVKE